MPAVPSSNKVPVAVVIHTLNEEINLERTLRNALAWADEVYVVDSGSTDRTHAIARSLGVEPVVRKHPRSEFTQQRNWALENLPFRNEWVFVQDADETVDDALAAEVRQCIAQDDGTIDGYWLRFKLIFQGVWIKHASLYPTWTMRLLRHSKARYEPRNCNTHPVVPAERTRQLREHLRHEDRTPLRVYLEKMNYYSDLEAIEYPKILAGQDKHLPKGNLFGTPPERRRALKRIFAHVPQRHWIVFFYLTFVRGGFLDGSAGLTYSTLRAFLEWLTLLKIEENSRLGAEGELTR